MVEDKPSLYNFGKVESISKPLRVDTIEYSRDAFFCREGVKKQPTTTYKDTLLKTRLRTLILEHGMKSESEFFQSIDISRQYWYRISWGLDICPSYLKIKIAKALDVDSIVIWGSEE